MSTIADPRRAEARRRRSPWVEFARRLVREKPLGWSVR